jgi:hypothetical protein
MISKNNFLVISNYNNDASWLSEYADNYLVYEKIDDAAISSPKIDPKKVIQSPNIGYNLYDYFTFIIDHYYDLPDCVLFIKGNVVPRHASKRYFDSVVNNNFFTPIEDPSLLSGHWPASKYSERDGFREINNSWYLSHFQTKYFDNYNDFLRFVYKDAVIPKYVRFAPGANYIVPKTNILKLPKVAYENLRMFISYGQLTGESHILERALYTLWTSPFELNKEMLKSLDPDFVLPKMYIKRTTKDRIRQWLKKVIK